MVDVQDPPVVLTPSERVEVQENVAHADEIVRWLDALGPVGRRRDVGALAADLSDLYAAATTYRRLVDHLLALGPRDRVAASDATVEIVTELRHMAWHIRSVAPRLERLASALDPDD
mgnify:CR=1 FL=1